MLAGTAPTSVRFDLVSAAAETETQTARTQQSNCLRNSFFVKGCYWPGSCGTTQFADALAVLPARSVATAEMT